MGTARVIREEDVLLPSYRDNGALIWRAWCPAYRARYKPWPHRSRTWYPSSLTTACALITLGVLSSRAVEALRPRISRTRSIAVQATALEEMHSRNRQMIATAVGRRGKWRTSWRGVTTKPGRP